MSPLRGSPKVGGGKKGFSKVYMQPAGPNNNWHYSHKFIPLARQRDLEEAGFCQLRFRNGEILNRIDQMIVEIEKCIKSLTSS